MSGIRDHVAEALGQVNRPPHTAVHKAKFNGGGHRDPQHHTPPQQAAWKTGSFSAKELQAMDFPPIAWTVPNIIPAEGVVLLCSKPKFGKSWLAYDLSIACTTDRFTLGTIKPAQGDVLYLALEDSSRRLQRRMKKLLPTFGSAWPDKLLLKTEWRRLHEGGVDDIRAWHADTKKTGGKPIVVVIDVLAKVRKPVGNSQLYEADYAALGDLTKLANELGLAIVVVHHTRKMAADDLMETVSGSFGVSGAVDTILVMANKPNGAVLDIRGRDVESAELAIEFDKQTCRWRLLGDAAEVHLSSQRAQVIVALREAGSAMKIPALVEETGMKRNPLEVLLGRMAKEGEIRRVGKGLYAHLDYVSPPDDPPPANPPNKTKQGKSKHGTPRLSLVSVRSSKVPTDPEAEAPSAQTQETTGENPLICPSVQSVREADTKRLRVASVPAPTDRTDRQTGASLVTEQSTELAAAAICLAILRARIRTDRSAITKDRYSARSFTTASARLGPRTRSLSPMGSTRSPTSRARRKSVLRGRQALPEERRAVRVSRLAPPGDSPDGAEGIEEEEEEEGVWTL